MPVALQDLLGLWRGDESSFGYAQEALAYEICRRLRPQNVKALFDNLYPGCDLDDLDGDVRQLIDRAYARWRKERK